MAWYRAGGGSIDDGNSISYPIALPSQDNKGYKEASISAIAEAIGSGSLTVAQMPSAISNLHDAGLIATNMAIGSATYTSGDLGVT